MKDHERKAWIIRARQRISLLEQDNAILRKQVDELRAKLPDYAKPTTF